MIDLFLRLIEQVAKLAGIRGKNRREYFDRYVQPTYVTSELIYKDYCSLLRDLRTQIEANNMSEPIIRFLEDRRCELRPARDRLKAFIKERIREGRVTRFEAGILGLMTGAITGVDRPYFQIHSYSEEDGKIWPQPGRHTILDILQKLKHRGNSDFSSVRAELLTAIEDKIYGIEEAWQNVLSGYAQLHASTIPPVGMRSPRKMRLSAVIAAMQSHLQEIHDMIDSGRFERKPATYLEKLVTDNLPELSQIAQELRETIHDLDNKEPNVTIADLEDNLILLEQELDNVLKKVS